MIAELLTAWKQLRRASIERREKAAIAKAFNDRYCYRREWTEESHAFLPGTALCRSGYAWMCPECNRISRPTECTVWTGVQYPACCGTPTGHRLSAGIRTS